jgi:hypothetical protein
MPAALPFAVRQLIWEQHQAGHSRATIAAQVGCSPWTVRRILRAAKRAGSGPLPPAYPRCAHPGPRSPRLLVRAIHWLKRRHPTWGAGLIRTILAARWPDQPLPSMRTMQRWWAAAAPAPRPTVDRPPAQPPLPRATAPHTVWQIDAVEQVSLADGSGACWLTISDEATGAVLSTTAFPPPVLVARARGARARRDPGGSDGLGLTGRHPGG